VRRVPLAAVALALAVGAVPAQAGVFGKQRTASAEYTAGGVDSPGAGVPGMYVRASAQGGQLASATFATLTTDRAVTVDLADDSGRPVLAAVVQHPTGSARDDVEIGRICGTGTLRLSHPGHDMTVYPLAGQCNGSPSAPTTGTVTVTLG
jgi:hypothetical protein